MVDSGILEKSPKWRQRLSGEDGALETVWEGRKSCFSVGKTSEIEESHGQIQGRTFQCWGGDAGLVPCQERLNSSKEEPMGKPQKKGCGRDRKALDDRSFLNNSFSAVFWRQFLNPIE